MSWSQSNSRACGGALSSGNIANSAVGSLPFRCATILSNKSLRAKKTLIYHNGRGAQEGLFAELKSQIHMDYVPTRRRAGNRAFLMASLLAHNLNRELQMRCHPRARTTTEKRAPLWKFEQLGTLRKKIIQRAGRLTKPSGKFTLTMGVNDAVKAELLGYLRCLEATA
jgi:hypothetical protein